MSKSIVLLVFLSLSLSGCKFVNDLMSKISGKKDPAPVENTLDTQGDDEVASSDGAAEPAPVEESCESGQAIQVLSGDCSGEWRVSQKDDGTYCEFEWGPRISCPDGTTPKNYESVCYGVTANIIDAIKEVTVNDCVAKFGKFPKSPAYELKCCPN